ncbi:unannotated protein [freshwater metagenome]|uniref:Unannotated protein n=1 Tax=freshwater metagenome TaxID=449393 RepID=A0A6J7G6W7_9ZZZZ|nr:hypothetical protein [Actinomycetota bacterium]
MTARRARGLDALSEIPKIIPDDPARRGDAPATADETPAPVAAPAKAKAPRRRAPTQVTSAPENPPAVSAPAPPRQRSSAVAPTAAAPSGRSDLASRSYIVPSVIADQLRKTSRDLNTSDSALIHQLLRASLADLPNLARYTQSYLEWRDTTDLDLFSVRVSTQTTRAVVDHLERVTGRLDEAVRQSGAGRMSLSRVVTIVLFGHFYNEQSGELAPDLDALREQRTAAQRDDLARRLAALADG